MTIVVAVDRSDRATRAIEEAGRLAAAFDDEVHVVHVLGRSEFVELGRTRAEAGDPVDIEDVRAVAAEIATEAAADLAGPVESVGLVGDPEDEVVAYAEAEDARYLVVAGRKRSPAGKAVFGSVTQSVILNATCPVVAVMRASSA